MRSLDEIIKLCPLLTPKDLSVIIMCLLDKGTNILDLTDQAVEVGEILAIKFEEDDVTCAEGIFILTLIVAALKERYLTPEPVSRN